MDKITEALRKLLPENQFNEVATAVKEMLTSAKGEMEQEYNKNLEEAYAQLSQDLEGAEKTAYNGYQEAYSIISDLRTRLELQSEEFNKNLEEGYEEAYQMLLSEKNKNKEIETEYDSKLSEMKNYIVEKVDQFLQQKGVEIYEQAKKDVLSDPAMFEHKIALDKIADIAANYLSNEESAFANTSKLTEASKCIEELRNQVRLLEARSIRLSTDNTKLHETVKKFNSMVSEGKQKPKHINEQKERSEKVKNVLGRGHVDTDNVQVIAEYNSGNGNENNELLVLSGIKKF